VLARFVVAHVVRSIARCVPCASRPGYRASSQRFKPFRHLRSYKTARKRDLALICKGYWRSEFKQVLECLQLRVTTPQVCDTLPHVPTVATRSFCNFNGPRRESIRGHPTLRRPRIFPKILPKIVVLLKLQLSCYTASRMSLGSHQRTIGKSQVHITPKWIIDALGPFDLDPCAALPRPWDCAAHNIALPRNGLSLQWSGFVWLNPPFHRYEVASWIEKLAAHDHGIALLHARTETAWFKPVWRAAAALLFLDKRITFCKPDGALCTTLKGEPANSGAPPVLVAFGSEALGRLCRAKIPGTLVTKWQSLS
jgi:DNA N-6-adenine-methyltransferase (Dam)